MQNNKNTPRAAAAARQESEQPISMMLSVRDELRKQGWMETSTDLGLLGDVAQNIANTRLA